MGLPWLFVCTYTQYACVTLICLYRSCEDDRALYSAFNLSRLFDVRMEIVNTSQVQCGNLTSSSSIFSPLIISGLLLQVFDELEQEVNETINSFNYTSDSFLDNDTRNALNNFTSANVDAINITGTYTVIALNAAMCDTLSTRVVCIYSFQ